MAVALREKQLPPFVSGLPFIGNALSLRSDMTAFLVRNYHQHGSVFRIRVLNQEYFILGGIDANRLLSKEGNTLFTGEGVFGGFAEQCDSDNFLPAMEGETHRHLRKILRPGYSKEAVAPHLQQLLDITTGHIDTWSKAPRVGYIPVTYKRVSI